MALSNTEITESLFQSVEVIVDEKIRHIECDITDICIIVDDSDAKNGNYWVSTNNGTTKYKAISESDEYKKNEKVRVSIPKGDYTGDKYIVGKCADDELIKPITYVSPLDTVIDITGNIVSEQKQNTQFELVANGVQQEIPIWSADLSLDKTYQDLQATGIYNTITLKANFKTLLGDYTIRSGSYGLRLDVYIKLNPTSNKYIVRSVYLDSSEMFGDPYNFLIPSSQSKKFDLSKLGTVDKLSLWFYQDGNFTYYDTKERKTLSVPYRIAAAKDSETLIQLPANLLVKDINIGFGSDLSIINDNTLQGYSLDSRKYRYVISEEDNQKRIGFLWYNKDENNQYIGFNDGIVDFETDDYDNIEYTSKKDANGNEVGEAVLNTYGFQIQEFKRDDEGNIILEKYYKIEADSIDKIFTKIEFNELGKDEEEQFLPIEEEKTSVENEIVTLKEKYLQDLNNSLITSEEYNNLMQDINDYRTIYFKYLNDYKDVCITYLKNKKLYNDAIEDDKEPPFEEAPTQPVAIFKQTYILQNKITPFLVKKVKPYDEIAYLEESEGDVRLTSQMGKEGVPTDKDNLTLSANLIEAKPLLLKSLDLVTKDLVSTIRTFDQRTGLINGEFKEMIKLLLTSAAYDKNKVPYTDEQTLNVWNSETKKMIDTFYSVCEQYLLINYRNQENLKLEKSKRQEINFTEDEKELQDWYNGSETIAPKIDLHNMLIANFGKLPIMINAFLNKAQLEIKEQYSGYQGVFDTYNTKILKILQIIENNVNQALKELLIESPKILDDFNIANLDSKEYFEYNKKDFSNCDNRYSIYWYRYELGYVDETDRLIKTDWRRLKTENDFGIKAESTELVYNFGLPIYDEFIDRDGQTYFSHKAVDTYTLARRLMDGNLKEEKYKIILFYNHEMCESDEIIFTNLDEVPDLTTVDKTDAIAIKHGENSQETYQNYDSNNYLHNLADASKSRTISVHYEGLMAGDEILAEAQVYWYIPNANTMLNCDDDYLTTVLNFASDKNIDIDKKPDYSKEGYTCYYKKIESDTVEIEDDEETEDIDESGEKTVPLESDLNFIYKIKDYYVSTANRNGILCVVQKDGYTFETEVIFTFTSFGTSGTDYTLTVTPATAQNSILADKPLSLNIALYDYKNDKIPIADTLLAENGASEFKVEWEGPSGYYDASEIIYGEDNQVTGVNVIMPTPPETKEDKVFGIMKVSATCPIEYQNTLIDDEEVDENDENQIDKTKIRDVKLTTFYPIPYSAGDYYIEGATTVTYDNSGSNPSYYKDPYKIFKINTNEDLASMKIIDASGTVTNKNHYDIVWKVVYYKKGSGNKIEKLSDEDHSDYDLCKNYMPSLNKKNGLTPSAMFLENMQCWCAVECWGKDLKAKESDYSLLWSQPILIIKNRYPSPMLNSWDGALTIDKKNGTIMSSLIGAGKKTINNTFEGILMGDIEGGASIYEGVNKTGMGLYGFNDGAQSFGFNIDGTGFIGKSGRGRIEFDGNKGLIQSASYSADSNHPFGMKIDLDDGFIDMKGGTEYDEQDWIDTIVARYKKLLDGTKIKEAIIPLKTQAALLQKIEEDAKNVNTLNVNLNIILQTNATNKGKEKFKIFAQRIDESPVRYYALSTLRCCKIAKKFTITENVDGVNTEVEYTFSKKQYNAIKKHADEFILSETYDGACAIDDAGIQVSNYKERYGKLSKSLQLDAEKTHQSQIHIDVKSPYFYIVSEQGKRLINVGDLRDSSDTYKHNWEKYDPVNDAGSWKEPNGKNLKKGYYLKSNNFSPVVYEGSKIKTPGSGTVIDLDSGQINSYHFSLQSKFLYINGWANEEKSQPFFILKDEEGRSLMYASTADDDKGKLGNFYLQSSSYAQYLLDKEAFNEESGDEEPDPKGTRINVGKGTITSYDFTLKGISTDSDYKGSYIALTSDPKLVVSLTKAKDDDDGDKAYKVNLLDITPSKFIMHSNDWGQYTEIQRTDAQAGSGIVDDGPWNVRKGPGTDKAKTGDTVTSGQSVKIYEVGTGPDTKSNTTWYRIGKQKWITKRALIKIEQPKEASETKITYTQGMEFNINKSVLKLYRGDRVLRIAANDIDNKDKDYGIYLGRYNDATGETTWNLRLGWDGVIVGRSEDGKTTWRLDHNGWRTT